MLHPKLQLKVRELQDICKKDGLLIGIGECLRSRDEQDALYAKGRSVPGKIVTNARGSTYSSMHQWGVAFDFYRKDGGAYDNSDGFFDRVGAVGKKTGLMWGGDWVSPVDKPHFQLPDWGKGTSQLKKKYKTPENFMKTWEDKAMTQSERDKLSELSEAVKKLSENQEKIYHYTTQLPDWARPTVQKLLDKGFYSGNSAEDLNLPESLMRNLVINDRAGLYK